MARPNFLRFARPGGEELEGGRGRCLPPALGADNPISRKSHKTMRGGLAHTLLTDDTPDRTTDDGCGKPRNPLSGEGETSHGGLRSLKFEFVCLAHTRRARTSHA